LVLAVEHVPHMILLTEKGSGSNAFWLLHPAGRRMFGGHEKTEV